MATNRQILEGLWALGIDQAKLAAIPTRGTQTAFKKALRSAGIGDDQIDRAGKLVDYRVDKKNTPTGAVLATVPLFGEDAMAKVVERARILGGGKDPSEPEVWLTAVEQTLGAQAASQIRIKAGVNPKPEQWNPFRDDGPMTPISSTSQRPIPGEAVRGRGLVSNPFPAATPASISSAVPKDRAGVENLQRLLNERGANLKVDGLYGPATKAAHQQYGAGKGVAPTAVTPPPGQTLGAALGGGPGVSTATGAPTANPGGVPPLPASATDEQVEAHIRRHFGFAAWALDTPEIRQKLVDFTKRMRGLDTWTEDDLEAELLTTQWWKDKTSTQRARIQERNEDPGTYTAGINGEMDNLRELANQYGVTVSDVRLREMASQAYSMGWSTSERRAAISAEFDYNPDTGQNAASKTVAGLRALASSYLVPLSEKTIDDWGRKIIAGTATEDVVTGYLREQAKQLLPSFARQIDAGLTPESLVEPYRQVVAKELGADPAQIDMLDAKYNRFVSSIDPKTNAPAPMNFFDIQRTIRTDETYGWDKTHTAVSEANEFATQLAKRFGRAG